MSALDVLAGLVAESGARWGEVATADQWADARAVLASDGPRRHWLGRSRGYSKTSDAAGLTLAALLDDLPAGSSGYAAAADRDQARLLVDALRGYVARTPELAGALQVDQWRATAMRRGTTLEALAADGPGNYGLRPAWLILDELAQWAETPSAKIVYEALTTALPKVAGARMLVMTSAGAPSHWSAKVHTEALGEPLRWRVSDLHGPPPWMDPDEVAGERRRLPASVFARLFSNVWSEPEDRLANEDDLLAAAVLDGPLEPDPRWRYVATLDVGLTNDRTVCVVAHAEPETSAEGRRVQRVVVDRLAVWQGRRGDPVDLGAVEAWLLRVGRDYRCTIVADPYQAAQLVQRLQGRGVSARTWTFSATSVGRLGSGLHVLLRERLLSIPKDDALLDELRRVRLRETSPGVFRLDHATGQHDDQAVAVALAASVLLETANTPARSVSVANMRLPPSIPGGGMPLGAGRDLAVELSRGFGQQSSGRGGRFLR